MLEDSHRPTARWHLNEMAVMISGKQFWRWRAVDREGEVLDLLGQRTRKGPEPLSSCVGCLRSKALVLSPNRIRSLGKEWRDIVD
jgi:hypothetical protein